MVCEKNEPIIYFLDAFKPFSIVPDIPIAITVRLNRAYENGLYRSIEGKNKKSKGDDNLSFLWLIRIVNLLAYQINHQWKEIFLCWQRLVFAGQILLPGNAAG